MINIIGPILDTSGYSSHTRNLANALNKITDVRLSTKLIPDWPRFVNDAELEMIKKQPERGEINLIIGLPHQWKAHTNSDRNWAYLVWEGDKIPASWVDECLNPDIEYIFVPSQHTYEAIKTTYTENKDEVPWAPWESPDAKYLSHKIKIIPHGVDPTLFYPVSKIEDKDRPFTFIANKGFRNMQDRGGVQYLIEAFTKEFNKDENVKLLIKINPAYGIPDLNQLVAKIAPDKEFPKIEFNVENLPYNELVDFYSKGDVFVSPTRAESFNIPCLEAMACGKPVITTNFGGQTDYCNNGNGWLISGELVEVKHEIMYEGIKWLTPSVKELREVMRQAFRNKTIVDQDLNLELSKKALKTARKLSWDNSAKKIKDLL